MNLVLLLLCSGFVHFAAAANRLRRFYLNDKVPRRWNDSLEICKNHSMSLVTLYDEEDAKSLEEFISGYINITQCDGMKTVWLGLERIRENVTTWSNSEPYTFNLTNVTVTPEEQRCGAVENNKYTDFGCNKSFHFMCYEGNNYHLIDHMKKDWCQAQQYCRRHFRDLVNIHNGNQKRQVVEEGRNKIFWIGLLHDEWEWQDGSCSTYRSWKILESSENCAAQYVPYSHALYGYECSSEAGTLCSKGNVRIVVVRQNLTWENALDYCLANHSGLLWIEDEDDQKDVVEILKTLNVEGPLWIGLRQNPVFGFWIWSDRTVTYSNWENDRTPEMPSSRNCGVINVNNSRWQNEDCSDLHQFLCEEEISFIN
ncbi:lymphocyte antigen 75 [Pleuronectes platessa]|uniref:lymphocyte antigen 75 n=1 Tax=Pleuronectes platessa TaxID=8262 RepID=UPI00232A6EA0|nr:lymphocyte antigen 75 [Pleuronectes platessa]